MKDRSERFDDTFKLLLTLLTVLIAFSFALYQETIEPEFYGVTVFSYILLVVFWCVPNIIGGLKIARAIEYPAKLIGWYLLIFLLLMTFFRLSLRTFRIDLKWETTSLCFSFFFSYPFTIYLKEYIPSFIHKITQISLVVVTIITFCFLLMVPH